ncbi:hypothetical protein LINGRAPRIM_LOCUS271 [Linum grandiflorum]
MFAGEEGSSPLELGREEGTSPMLLAEEEKRAPSRCRPRKGGRRSQGGGVRLWGKRRSSRCSVVREAEELAEEVGGGGRRACFEARFDAGRMSRGRGIDLVSIREDLVSSLMFPRSWEVTGVVVGVSPAARKVAGEEG